MTLLDRIEELRKELATHAPPKTRDGVWDDCMDSLDLQRERAKVHAMAADLLFGEVSDVLRECEAALAAVDSALCDCMLGGDMLSVPYASDTREQVCAALARLRGTQEVKGK